MPNDHIRNEDHVRPNRVRPVVTGADRPVVIEARRISKEFRIPLDKSDTIKERLTNPRGKAHHRVLRALHEVSFDVHQGEFFGIVGRNGSGKSSLLKILASIYRPDQGTVRLAGRVAPFIELGVGFNPELTARDNVVLYGVLMGKSLREARRGLDEVLDFAELREFADLKLKNYSSGMMVRLAFSVMVQAEADVMLIDEVLAVGDASFAQKCMDVFYAKRDAGKTIVLVTHDMATVQALCHRAMLIHDGELEYLGSPEDAALGYHRLNFADVAGSSMPAPEANGRAFETQVNARVIESMIVNAAGEPIRNIAQGQPINLRLTLAAARDLQAPLFLIHVRKHDGPVIFGFERRADRELVDGDQIQLSGRIDHQLVAGSYMIECWVREDRRDDSMGVQGMRLTHFDVYGEEGVPGLVVAESDIEVTVSSPLSSYTRAPEGSDDDQ